MSNKINKNRLAVLAVNFSDHFANCWYVNVFVTAVRLCQLIQSPLVISKSKDSMKHFEVSVLRHIRVERVSKTIN